MPLESRAFIAFVALTGIALGSGVTYGFDHLDAPKPVIISDAVEATPTPPAVQDSMPADDDTASVVNASFSPAGTVAAMGDSAKKRKSSEKRGKHQKITSGIIHINTADSMS